MFRRPPKQLNFQNVGPESSGTFASIFSIAILDIQAKSMKSEFFFNSERVFCILDLKRRTTLQALHLF